MQESKETTVKNILKSFNRCPRTSHHQKKGRAVVLARRVGPNMTDPRLPCAFLFELFFVKRVKILERQNSL